MTTADPLVGATLDRRYYVESRIAGGGMATVYVGHDLRLDRRLALKVMHFSLAQDPSFVRRFINEAHSVAKLSHPNVVQVYDQGNDQGHVYLAMEYVAGRTLRDMLNERGRLDSQQALQVMAPVLAALGAAHQAGMVHRDVKPENVLLTEDGRVKVADFGLARAVEDSQQGMTKTGTVMGTAAYLAPEQIERGTSDARSDVYAAGIMLYELLTGSQPHTGENPIAIAYQHVNSDVPRPSSVVPGTPPAVDELVTKATERDPRYRPSNAGQYLTSTLKVMPPGAGAAVGQTSPLAYDTAVPAPAGDSSGSDTLEVNLEGADFGGPEQRPWLGRYGRYAALAFGVVLLAVLLGFGWWMLFGRYENVPELAGLDEQAAEQRLSETGLELVVAGERAYSDQAEAGQIAESSPGAGEQILPGDTVTVTLSKGPQVIDMPDVVGEPVSEARTTLEETGLAEIEEQESVSYDEPPGTVLSSDPEPGADADRENAVTLEVSSGFEVPEVVGSPEDDARGTLEEAGLNVEVNEVSSDADEGEVVGQDPEAGVTAGPGDTVTIAVSSGAEKIEIPDVTGFKVKDAEKELKDRGFEVEVNESLLGGDRVQSFSPQGEAEEGETIELTVGPFVQPRDPDDGEQDDGDGDNDDEDD